MVSSLSGKDARFYTQIHLSPVGEEPHRAMILITNSAFPRVTTKLQELQVTSYKSLRVEVHFHAIAAFLTCFRMILSDPRCGEKQRSETPISHNRR